MAKSILVIDDDEGILEGFEAILKGSGYKVTTAASAHSLFSLIKTSSPDLILLDILLSGVDGRDVCRKLKKDRKTKHIPVIMISAHPKAQKDLKDIDADGFLAKPFEMDDLLGIINKFVNKNVRKVRKS